MKKLKTWAKRLKTDIPALFLALRCPETPIFAKILAFLTEGYALSPIDLIPDFIPVLGYVDDLILLPLLAAATIRLMPQEVLTRCRREAAGMWQDGKPKKWYYAIPIAALWGILVLWVLKLLL